MISVSARGEEAQRVAWKVRDSLGQEQVLRTTTSDIQVVAEEGLVSLVGRVRTNIMRNLASRLASAAVNGWKLRVDLLSDEALALDLATRLAMDPRTVDVKIHCEVYMGVARLTGQVLGSEQHAVVLEVASQVSGIARVEDVLSVAR